MSRSIATGWLTWLLLVATASTSHAFKVELAQDTTGKLVGWR